VDDDPIVLAILASMLDELGIDCVQARDGRSGLRQLTEDMLSVDLLVTDLIMPDLGGDALVMAVRDLGGERDLPIVVVSAYLDAERAQALRIAGADAVVDKGNGLAPVVAAARSLLAARGRLDEVVATREEPPPVPLFRIPLARVKH
jgi:CheY-like chemotaxis protein